MTGKPPSVRGIDRVMEGGHGRMWRRCTDSGSTRHRDVEVGLSKLSDELHLSCRWTSHCEIAGRVQFRPLGSGRLSLGGLRKKHDSASSDGGRDVIPGVPKVDTGGPGSP